MEALPRPLRAWFQYNMDLHDENARQNDRNDALPQKKPPQKNERNKILKPAFV